MCAFHQAAMTSQAMTYDTGCLRTCGDKCIANYKILLYLFFIFRLIEYTFLHAIMGFNLTLINVRNWLSWTDHLNNVIRFLVPLLTLPFGYPPANEGSLLTPALEGHFAKSSISLILYVNIQVQVQISNFYSAKSTECYQLHWSLESIRKTLA